MSRGYGCVFPSCHCRSFCKSNSKEVQGSLLRYSTVCDGCGHAQHLHRPCTETDKLVVQEVSAAAITAGCHGLIPMSCLSRMDLFGPYHLIPIPTDIGNEEDTSVACGCLGFQVGNLAKTLQDFHRLPATGVRSALSQLMCTSCPHTLATHLHQEQRQSGFDCIFELISSCDVSEHQLTHELLQLSVSPNGTLVLVGIANSHQGQPRLLVRWCYLTAGNDAGICEQSDLEDLSIANSKGGSNADKPVVEHSTDSSFGDPPNECAKGRSRKRKNEQMQPGNVRRSARLTAQNSACVPDAMQSSMDLIRKEREAERVRTAFVKNSVEECFKHTAEPNLLDLSEHMPSAHAITHHQIVALSIDWLFCSSAPPTLVVAVGVYDGRILVFIIGLSRGQPFVQSSVSYPENEGLDQVLTCLSICTTVAAGGSELLVCAGFDSGTLRFMTVGLTDNNRCLGVLKLSFYFNDTCSPVTKCSWSSNGRHLAAGTQYGQLLVYSKRQSSVTFNDGTNYSLINTVCCCAAPVTSLSWRNDNSSMVVGSDDNLLHILTITTASNSSSKQHSLFKYFEPVHKVDVSCQLIGHLSAVASTIFLGEHLLSAAWDSRLLVWPLACTDGSGEIEPSSVFKLGPALGAESVAQAMVTLGNNLLVAVYEKGGSVRIVLYHQQQILH